MGEEEVGGREEEGEGEGVRGLMCRIWLCCSICLCGYEIGGRSGQGWWLCLLCLVYLGLG